MLLSTNKIKHILLAKNYLAYPVSILICLIYNKSLLANEKYNSLTVFTGELTKDEITLPIPEFEESTQLGISYNRKIKDFKWARIEFDTSIYKHYLNQFHWEISAAFLLRYYILKEKISFAVGEGLSYASDVPRLERIRHVKENRLLNLVIIELSYDLDPSHAVALRWHHRSGVWGLFNGVEGGSNSVQFGFRFKF